MEKSNSGKEKIEKTQKVEIDLNEKVEEYNGKVDANGTLRLSARAENDGQTKLALQQNRPVDRTLIGEEQMFMFTLPDDVGIVNIKLREDVRIPSDGEAPYRLLVRLKPEQISTEEMEKNDLLKRSPVPSSDNLRDRSSSRSRSKSPR